MGCRFGVTCWFEPQTHLALGDCQIGSRFPTGARQPAGERPNSGTAFEVPISVAARRCGGDGCVIGPYAQLALARNWADCRVGNFVEIKQSHLAARLQGLNHLSYIGDTSSVAGVMWGPHDHANYRRRAPSNRTVIGRQQGTGAKFCAGRPDSSWDRM